MLPGNSWTISASNIMAALTSVKIKTHIANQANDKACFLFTDHNAISGLELVIDLAAKKEIAAKTAETISNTVHPIYYGKNSL